MRPIDADALYETLCHVWDRSDDEEFEQAVFKVIANAPTVDAVELVRCKDCRWYEIYQLKQDGTDDRRYNPSYCTLFRHRFKPDWYCADGERKGEEDEHRAHRTAEEIL